MAGPRSWLGGSTRNGHRQRAKSRGAGKPAAGSRAGRIRLPTGRTGPGSSPLREAGRPHWRAHRVPKRIRPRQPVYFTDSEGLIVAILRKFPIVFVVLALALAVVFGLLERNRQRQPENQSWVAHTEQVLAELSSTQA